MSKLPKLLTQVFGNENEEVGKEEAEQREKVEQILAILTHCPEDVDLVERPNFQEVIEAFDKLREKCAPSLKELVSFESKPSEILRLWLRQTVNENRSKSASQKTPIELL
jgi:hypothetical protein